ncbi:hypothetical protein L1887_49576 [Cichorium endivia]|nr:hypothetical protein L1887_49576 [Cichorium endivia]
MEALVNKVKFQGKEYTPTQLMDIIERADRLKYMMFDFILNPESTRDSALQADKSGYDMELIEKIKSIKLKIENLISENTYDELLDIIEDFHTTPLNSEISEAFQLASAAISEGRLLQNIELYKAATEIFSVNVYTSTPREISFLFAVENDESIQFTYNFTWPERLHILKKEARNMDDSVDGEIHDAISTYYQVYAAAILLGKDQAYFDQIAKDLSFQITNAISGKENVTSYRHEEMQQEDVNQSQQEPEPTIEIDGKKYTIAEYKELEEKAMKKLQRSMRAKGSNAK